MTQEHAAKDVTDAIRTLLSLVNKHNVSSLDLLSDKLDCNEDVIRELIQSLVDKGELHGEFTDDGERFFKSDTKQSKAPVLSSHNEPIIHRADTSKSRYIFLTGFILFIVGQAFANLGLMGEFGAEIGFALVICSILVIVFGLVYASQRSKTTIQF